MNCLLWLSQFCPCYLRIVCQSSSTDNLIRLNALLLISRCSATTVVFRRSFSKGLQLLIVRFQSKRPKIIVCLYVMTSALHEHSTSLQHVQGASGTELGKRISALSGTNNYNYPITLSYQGEINQYAQYALECRRLTDDPQSKQAGQTQNLLHQIIICAYERHQSQFTDNYVCLRNASVSI